MVFSTDAKYAIYWYFVDAWNRIPVSQNFDYQIVGESFPSNIFFYGGAAF